MGARSDPFSPRLARALRLAAFAHRAQNRRGSGFPYIEHPIAVAWLLDRLGFDEDVVIAGLLHDAVEDTEIDLSEVEAGIGSEIARIVAACSEVKHDAQGNKRPWIDRKCDHLAAVAGTDVSVAAVMLADKWHNLTSIEADLCAGRPVWSFFHADREHVLWYYRAMIDVLDQPDPRLSALVERCREVLTRVERL